MATLKNEGSELLRFWRLVHEVTGRLVGAQATELDAAVDDCLRKIGKHFQVSQVGLGQWSKAGQILPALRTWGSKPVSNYMNTVGPGPEAFAYLCRKGSLIWNCPEDLEELPQFREHVQQVGATAGVFCLHRDFGSHTDHLVMAKANPTVWPEYTVECLAAVSGTLFNALYRRKAEVLAEQMLRLEQIISEVAADVGQAGADDLDAQINRALRQIGEATGADLSVFLRCAAKESLTVSHEWDADTIDKGCFVGARLADDYPWLARYLKGGEPLLLYNLDDFPSEAEFELSEQVGIQSMVWAPFQAAHGTHGYLGLSTVNRTVQWPEGVAIQLGLMGRILSNAIDRNDMDLGMAHTLDEIEGLKEKLAAENLTLRQEIGDLYSDDEVIGKSHVFRSAIFQAQQVAATDSTVLLLGETGTGKGLIARRIHEQSGRSHRPLVTVNCAALPSTLIESELFGHEKGAFTGATTRKIGRFELADGGTIFLDEVGDLPTDLQAKLLRVLQDRQFERLGSSITKTVDVRVIAATNRDLDKLIEQGEFRADLYYRLGVFPIRAPALRERRGDIPLLLWFFVSELQHRLGKTFDTVSERTMDTLTSYDWPGNVRELQNIVERAMILSEGPKLELGSWFPGNSEFKQTPAQTREQKGETIAEIERAHITKVLESCNWKVRGKLGAAEQLGLKRTTLQSRMKKLGIKRPTI